MSDSHVLEFARANRLRHVRLSDGEAVLPIGPRKRAASPTNHLGAHAWHAGGTTWRILVTTAHHGPMSEALRPHVTGILTRDKGELEATCDEAHLIAALDAGGGLTKPWRRRVPVSEALRAQQAQRLATLREARQKST